VSVNYTGLCLYIELSLTIPLLVTFSLALIRNSVDLEWHSSFNLIDGQIYQLSMNSKGLFCIKDC